LYFIFSLSDRLGTFHSTIKAVILTILPSYWRSSFQGQAGRATERNFTRGCEDRCRPTSFWGPIRNLHSLFA